jgi:hypothetical protein
MKKRVAKETKEFKADGTFESLRAAQLWLTTNGYSYGSLCRDEPVAIMKGDYDIPQKWRNIHDSFKNKVDGVILSNDFIEGSVTVILYN